ncbi:hypothetical protein SAMN02990966_07191, partial [Rhodospirillales bacterium URHD0017]
ERRFKYGARPDERGGPARTPSREQWCGATAVVPQGVQPPACPVWGQGGSKFSPAGLSVAVGGGRDEKRPRRTVFLHAAYCQRRRLLCTYALCVGGGWLILGLAGSLKLGVGAVRRNLYRSYDLPNNSPDKAPAVLDETTGNGSRLQPGPVARGKLRLRIRPAEAPPPWQPLLQSWRTTRQCCRNALDASPKATTCPGTFRNHQRRYLKSELGRRSKSHISL